MARAPVEIVIEFDDSKLIGQRVRQRAGLAVRKAAMDIRARAQANAPVDTGALHNSIYVVTNGTSDYMEAAEAVLEANAEQDMTEEVSSSGALSAAIVVGVEYGVHVEKGTTRQAAQPFLEPAVEAVKPSFLQALEQIISEP